jgi:hypothetical protein
MICNAFDCLLTHVQPILFTMTKKIGLLELIIREDGVEFGRRATFASVIRSEAPEHGKVTVAVSPRGDHALCWSSVPDVHFRENEHKASVLEKDAEGEKEDKCFFSLRTFNPIDSLAGPFLAKFGCENAKIWRTEIFAASYNAKGNKVVVSSRQGDIVLFAVEDGRILATHSVLPPSGGREVCLSLAWHPIKTKAFLLCHGPRGGPSHITECGFERRIAKDQEKDVDGDEETFRIRTGKCLKVHTSGVSCMRTVAVDAKGGALKKGEKKIDGFVVVGTIEGEVCAMAWDDRRIGKPKWTKPVHSFVVTHLSAQSPQMVAAGERPLLLSVSNDCSAEVMRLEENYRSFGSRVTLLITLISVLMVLLAVWTKWRSIPS